MSALDGLRDRLQAIIAEADAASAARDETVYDRDAEEAENVAIGRAELASEVLGAIDGMVSGGSLVPVEARTVGPLPHGISVTIDGGVAVFAGRLTPDGIRKLYAAMPGLVALVQERSA